MKHNIIKNCILFITGFCIYITIETLYRGYSFWQMGLCGGLIIVLLDKLNDRLSFDMDILLQCAIGSAMVTFLEFVIGSISLAGYLPQMWDYSSLPCNYKGIICLPFSIIWMLLSFVAILLADAINYYVLEETELPYYKMFGKLLFKFKPKKCS